MKHLLLLRHAKSSWESADLSDHQRPLNERGKRDAPRMGHWICQQELQPDLVISSTALRAEQTARAVASECGSGAKAYALDVADKDAITRVVAQIAEDFGGVDILDRNALRVSRGDMHRQLMPKLGKFAPIAAGF